MDVDSSFDAAAPVEPRFPKSLYLIRPLVTSHELNPVTLTAQAKVPVPDGLDLNAWIVPPPADPIEEMAEKKSKKSKKGKGREVNGSSGKAKKQKRNVAEDENADLAHSSSHLEEETAEEQLERERVRSILFILFCDIHLLLEQRKAERLEQMRDDPYYLMDDRPPKTVAAEDLDVIPIVRLEELLPLPGQSSFENIRSSIVIPSFLLMIYLRSTGWASTRFTTCHYSTRTTFRG